MAERLQRLADGVWAYIQPDGGWMVNNMGLIDGGDGATSVDVTSTERRTRDYLGAVAEVTDAAVRRVVLTHGHPDHCSGLSLLPDAEIIAHRVVAEELQHPHIPPAHVFGAYEQGAVSPRVPTVVFDDGVDLTPGVRKIEVRHPGTPAHTRGDAYVWLPDERVLFTGDLVFNGGMPFALSGSPSGWLRTLEQLAALRPETVVPGHGPLGGIELLEPVADYLRFLIDTARDARERGLSPLAAVRTLGLGSFAGLQERERHVGNLHRALAELDGIEPDMAAAWSDMYDDNGERPLEVHA